MRRHLILLSLFALSLMAGGSLWFARSAQTRPSAAEVFGKLPLQFEKNQGQSDPRVHFLSHGIGYSLFLEPREAVLALNPVTKDKHPSAERAVLKMQLKGANAHASGRGADRLPGHSNYFIGDIPSAWRKDVPVFSSVRFNGIYPGIDIVYHGRGRQLEYDFVIAPGADPAQVKLGFTGADALALGDDGALRVTLAQREIQFKAPELYQVREGKQIRVEGAYQLSAQGELGFKVGPYDAAQPLIIDPTLTYASYLGGSTDDVGNAIALDASGNIYITGYASSSNYPVASAYQAARSGTQDAFVTKVNASGNALVYSTYLGGTATETGYGIAVDSAGNAYVVGQTSSSTFPKLSPIQTTLGGGTDAFITKLNPAGNALVYSTFLGGTGYDEAQGIALDSSNNAYVTGDTASSTTFPRVAAIQNTYGGGTFDAFVTKVNAAGTAWTYSTFLGGTLDDEGYAIAVDSGGSAYITGFTSSTAFPRVGAILNTYGGGTYDAFVTKVNAAGTAWAYSTYLGGAGEDEGYGIAVDAAGDAFVTGRTGSTNFPMASPIQAAQGDAGSSFDAFVTQVNAAGTAWAYSTYLGGNALDSGEAIALDSAGNAYVTGSTSSPNFPVANAVQAAFGSPNSDAFVTKIFKAGPSIDYSTYLGGSGGESGEGIAVDSSGNAYITGPTSSTNLTLVNPYQSSNTSTTLNGFFAKISSAINPSATPTSTQSPNWTATGTPTASATPTPANCSSQNVGYTTVGSNHITDGGYVDSLKVAMPAAGSVVGISMNFSIGGQFRVAIYDNGSSKPQNLLASSGVINGVPGWNYVSVGPVTVSAGTYYLAFQSDTTTTLSMDTTGVSGDEYYKSQAFGAFPASFPVGTASVDKYSIYADLCVAYTATASPTLTASPTRTASATVTASPTLTPTPLVAQGGPCGMGYRFGDMVEEPSNSDPGTTLTKLTATKFTLWENATVYGLWGDITTAGAGQSMMGIYTDNGLGTQPSLSITASAAHVGTVGWNYYPLASPVTLAPGNYWLTYQNSSPGTFITLRTTGGTTWATTGAVTFGSWPSNFPAGSGAAWVQQFAAAYCPVTTYNGNRTHVDTSWVFPLDDPTAKLSQRFTQKGNRTVTQVQLPIYTFNQSPTYRVSLQADNGAGQPTGVVLGSGNFTATVTGGWQTVAISPSVPLADGVIYHQVIDWVSGQATGTKKATFYVGSTPFNSKHPLDQSDDPGNGVLVAPLGTYDIRQYSNIYMLGDGSGWWGNAYNQVRAFVVHGNGTVPTTDDYAPSQVFQPPTTWYSDHLAVYVSGCASVSPGADLSYNLYDMSSGTTITSGVLISNGSAPLAPRWVEAALGSTITMVGGHNYRLSFRAPGIASPGYTVLANTQSAAGSPYQDLGFEGNVGWASASFDNGITESPYVTDDLPFLWRDAPPPTPTMTASPTQTATPTRTGTPTMTGTSTRTITPSATPSATMTVTPLPACGVQSDPFNSSVSFGAQWTTAAIGSATGSSQSEGAALTMTTSSSDIWGTADSCYYAFQSTNGDLDVEARVDCAPTTSSLSKIGIMLRDSTAPGAAEVSIMRMQTNWAFYYRLSNGGTTNGQTGGSTINCVGTWVRMVKTGASVAGYYSTNHSTWTQLGVTQTVALSSTYLAGMVVDSYNGASGFGTASGFSVLSSGCVLASPTSTPTATPSPSITPTSTPTTCSLTVSGPQSLGPGVFSYCQVHVLSGGTLNISGVTTIYVAGDFIVDAGGTVAGDGIMGGGGAPNSAGFGNGPGQTSISAGGGGGGAGHGNAGGSGGGTPGGGGGPSYDSLINPVLAGSGGAGGYSLQGGGGGGGASALRVSATGQAFLNGSIHFNGGNGMGNSAANAGAGGGGSGGALSINATDIFGTGSVQAVGGTGGNCGVSPCGGGGAGAGGRIDLCAAGVLGYSGSTQFTSGNNGFGSLGNGSLAGTGTYHSCGVLPSATPTKTTTPTRTPTVTLTPVPLAPVFGFVADGGGFYMSLNSATIKMAQRFAQRGNKTADQIGVNIFNIHGSPPQYRYSLYADANGIPAALPLDSQVSAVSPGWNAFPIAPQALTDGAVYYVVVEPDATPPDAVNYIDVLSSFGQGAWSVDQVFDPMLAPGASNAGFWTFSPGAGPVFTVHYSDSSVDGQGFSSQGAAFIYANNQSGEAFRAPAGGAWVGSVGAIVGTSGSPVDNLYYRLYDATTSSVIDSGFFCSPGTPVGTWVDAPLSGSFFLNGADNYRIEFSSPASVAGNFYTIQDALHNSALSQNAYTYGGSVSVMTNSTDGGSFFLGDAYKDIYFRFNQGLVPTLTATPSRTAQNTPTCTVTPTLSRTPTPSVTPSLTPCALDLSSGSLTLTAGSYSYCSVHLFNGTHLFILGEVTLNLTGNFTVDPAAAIIGIGRGYSANAGPSSGTNGGGGGHGGNGGTPPDGGGGSPYDSAANPVLAGSGGGSSTSAGGSGGAALIVQAPAGTAALNGSIAFDGGNATSIGFTGINGTMAGGGGAGGSFNVQAATISGSGNLTLSGGQGGGNANSGLASEGGGGGAGGRLQLCASGANTFAGTITVDGGNGGGGDGPGTDGEAGSYYRCGSAGFSPTSTVTGSITPTFTQTSTVTPTFSHTQTITPTFTQTSTISPTNTATSSVTPTFSYTQTVTPTFTQTSTISPTNTATSSVTPTFSHTQTVTPTFTRTSTISPTSTATSSVTPTFSDTQTITPTFTQTSTISPTNTATSSVTPTFSHTQTVTPTFTQTSTISPTNTATSSVTPTFSYTQTVTPTFTQTSTISPTNTSTSSVTPTFSHTQTVTPTFTRTSTISPTNTATSSVTPTFSYTQTITPTSTQTSTISPTNTSTSSVTPTFSATQTATASFSPTQTITTSATFTPTVTLTFTDTQTITPTDTQTSTITPSFSATQTVTPSASHTATVTPTFSQTSTISPTFSSTATLTPTFTATSTLTPSFSRTQTITTSPTFTQTVTATFSDTATQTVTLTWTDTRTVTPTFSATSTLTPANTATGTATPSSTRTPTALPTASGTVTGTLTPSFSPTQTAVVSATSTGTISPTWTLSDTPLPTSTPEVPAVLNQNIFRPGKGSPLHIGIKAPENGHVTVHVFNLAGEQVRRPFEADVPAGVTVDAIWNGDNEDGQACANGVYLVSVKGAGIRRMLKVVLLK